MERDLENLRKAKTHLQVFVDEYADRLWEDEAVQLRKALAVLNRFKD